MKRHQQHANTGKIAVVARDRTLPRLSAEYVFAGGRGKSAYYLTQTIEKVPSLTLRKTVGRRSGKFALVSAAK